MTQKIFCHREAIYRLLPLTALIMVLFFTTPTSAQGAQNQPAEKEEPASCNVKVGNKEYALKANRFGIFPQISNLQPSAVVPITVTYPQGAAGEKVTLTAEDGGWFENKKSVMAVSLNGEKKCVFNFYLTQNEGLFEVILRKGNDAKVIQLWVGED